MKHLTARTRGYCLQAARIAITRIEKAEGVFLRMMWNGDINERKMQSVSTSIEEKPPSEDKAMITYVNLGFHVSRKSQYYLWKVLLKY